VYPMPVASQLTPAAVNTSLRKQRSRLYPIISRQIDVDCKLSQFLFGLEPFKVTNDHGKVIVTYQVILHFVNGMFETGLKLTGGAVQMEAWSHIAATVQGNDASIYVNGDRVSVAKIKGDRLVSMDAQLQLGCDEENHFFHGYLYDLRIWNKSFDRDVIKEHRTAPLNPNNFDKSVTKSYQIEQGLVVHLLLNYVKDDGMFVDQGFASVEAFGVNVVLDETVRPPEVNISTDGSQSDSYYGYKCTIYPNFSLQTLLHSELFRKEFEVLKSRYVIGSFRHDLALVRYINEVVRARNLDADALMGLTWNDVSPPEEDLLRAPALKVRDLLVKE